MTSVRVTKEHLDVVLINLAFDVILGGIRGEFEQGKIKARGKRLQGDGEEDGDGDGDEGTQLH